LGYLPQRLNIVYTDSAQVSREKVEKELQKEHSEIELEFRNLRAAKALLW